MTGEEGWTGAGETGVKSAEAQRVGDLSVIEIGKPKFNERSNQPELSVSYLARIRGVESAKQADG